MGLQRGDSVEFFPNLQYPEFRSDGVGLSESLAAIVTDVKPDESGVNLFVFHDRTASPSGKWIQNVPVYTAALEAAENLAYYRNIGVPFLEDIANHALLPSDMGKMLAMNKASSVTVTVSLGEFQGGSECTIYQTGAGQVDVLAGPGVTVHGTPTVKLRARYSVAKLRCLDDGGDLWVLYGDLAAS